ncbi:Hypothetical predicted protein [Mytilus galloprovincialis]|uniref:DUF6589 domain-containing protein n=1 Tax=Mytilus galloprovincialis TaxID=29158 RepID=A0A8B6DCS8_MYTGA|nr:Hypothetical predicted protein [Mytilus galloprovincialis]
MIEVVQHLQQYVPKTNDGKLIPIMLGGDALSVERGEAASRARMDAITEEDRLEGFTRKSEDWHGHVISLQETFNLLYKGTSSGEKGTLFQLRNLFDRRGVKSQVSSAVNDDREFIRFSTQGYAVLAAFEVLNINSADELNVHIENLKTNEQKKKFLEKLSSDIVERSVATETFKFTHEGEAEKNTNNRISCGIKVVRKHFPLMGGAARDTEKRASTKIWKF